jgi:glycosyltransferase involved in cell wall biosynthesis
MKIAYIASGAGNMYCGTCLHDNSLAAALIKLGHQVALVPTYTPIRTDEESVSLDHVFYGGINVYLQQKSSFFRHTPSLIDDMFNSPALLKWISRHTSSTDAKELGPLTVSVLQGEEGKQKKELRKLIEWLKDDYKPDLVHLNNSMFVGFARDIKRELGVPVLCSLQGEDIFLEDLTEPYKSQALQTLKERAKDVDGFIATSHYYAEFMAAYLNLPISKIDTVRLGIQLKGHGESNTVLNEEPFLIGYLARICPEKGLHLLTEAFDILVRKGLNVRLKVAGYLGKRDEKYFEQIRQTISQSGWKARFEYAGEVDRDAKIRFLNQLHVFSVPAIYREPKGISVMEAMANGIPVVEPSHGAFPEMIDATGGGLLVKPNSASALAEGLESLMANRKLRDQLGRNGKAAIHRDFSDEKMAQETLKLYQRHLSSSKMSAGILPA